MLSAFPHLDDADFERACDGLQRRFQLKGSAQEDWLSVEKIHRNGTVYLNITTHLPRPAGIPAVQDRDATEVDEVVEHDEVGGCPTSADKSSIQDHPATNRPVFFIHPCQTAGVMEASLDRNVTADEYLMIWIGAMGKTVGLDVPLQLARPDDA
ncbi:hypothetical protein IG631_12365 [Alternaria alternata]|nr:hypothetical protein IG631_12365 [Alternaria alternata]